jgi:hypothetical protein
MTVEAEDDGFDKFLAVCAEGGANASLASHTQEMMDELKRKHMRSEHRDAGRTIDQFLLLRVARMEVKLIAIERLLRDLTDIATAAADR